VWGYNKQAMWRRSKLVGLCFHFLQLQTIVGYSLVNKWFAIAFDSKWMTSFQLCQNTLNCDQQLTFWCMNMEHLSKFTRDYWLFIVKILCTWVLCIAGWENPQHSGRNLDQPRSRRPVTITYDLHRDKVKLIQENWQISQRSIAEKSNTCLPGVNEITPGSGYKKFSAQWVSCPIMPKLKTARMAAHPWLLTCYEC
jgi:hypothetical protein